MTKDNDRRRQIDELADQLISESGGIDGLLQRLGVGPAFAMPELRQPTLLARRVKRVAYVLWIRLDDVEPEIWRQVVVPSDMTLKDFHEVMQAVMGWADSHLHAFRMGPGELARDVAAFVTELDIEEGEEGTKEADVRLDEVLGELGHRLYYEYDFGDGWEHTVILESIQPWEGIFAEVRCLAGQGACPLEDVGGVPGHQQLLDVLAGRTHDVDPEWAQTLREWAPPGYDPDHFDSDEANEAIKALEWPTMEGWHPEVVGLCVRLSAVQPTLVRQLGAAVDRQPLASDEEVEEALADLRLLLERVGADGIKLTQAGYLPPAVVKELFAGLSPALAHNHPFKPTTEVNTAPVLFLRESAMALGLVRRYKGSLVLTPKGRKVAARPELLWQTIVDAVPLGKEKYEVDAGLILLLGAAAGRDDYRDRGLYGALFEAAGWRVDGPPDVGFRHAAESTKMLLRLLGDNAGVAARLIRRA
ncbi:hypothetical protein GCM10025789_06460 [Tessaracoccus lubricantis]|uniref:Plasmid pRiA4b Orf3-like domain-containing protein n=1 Tax=Tessaracoccus lubricantis TaxID=545543 RepID=A0ABP9F1Q6_9ACTN